MSAVYEGDLNEFKKRGGVGKTDLNFWLTDQPITVLGMAIIKGDYKLVKLMLTSPSLNIHEISLNGVNYFWLSAFAR